MFARLQGLLLKAISCRQNWLSFFAGFILVFAYAPFEFWPLPLIVIPVWLVSLIKLHKNKFSSQGFFFGLGWFTSGISWVHVSIEQFGGMPLIFSLILMFLLCLYLAMYPWLATWITAKLSKEKPALYLFPSIWLFTEYLRGVVLTGFPWLSLGYSQIDSPLAPLAPIIGEVGITFVILSTAVAIAHLYSKQWLKSASLVLLVSGVSVVIASNMNWVTPQGSPIKTALVQGNVKQELKWLPEHEWPNMLMYLELTKAHSEADIVVWPESAVTEFEPVAQDYLSLVDDIAHENDSAIITGILNYNFETKQSFNSLIVLGKEHPLNEIGTYYYNHKNRFNKYHLLPIGEFVPFGDILRPIAPFFNLPQSSFSRGEYVQDNLIANGIHIAPLICFEIAFPEQLLANFTDKTQMLLTVSNDAWFGTSHGPDQHMEMARMRALEFGRPLLRSTNTGITATVDHKGQFISRLPQFEQAVLTSDVVLVEGETPYSKYGNASIYILALLIFNLAWFASRKR